jgi:hypothetical protein
MIRLTEDLSLVMEITRPMAPEARSTFLARVAAELVALGADAAGPGFLARLCHAIRVKMLTAVPTE